MRALLREWRRCPPVRHLVAAFLEYKPPPDVEDGVEWVARRRTRGGGGGMTKEAIAAMYGATRGVSFARAADDPVVRAAFPEHFAGAAGG